MIKYSASKILPLNRKHLLFDIILDYSKYKYFLPWCVDSYTLKQCSNTSEEIKSKLIKNQNFKIDFDKNIYSLVLNKENNKSEYKEFKFNLDSIEEGVLVVGLGVINFSYSSIVVYNKPNFVFSTVDEGSSIFSKLESIWEINDIISNPHNLNSVNTNCSDSIEVNYQIKFEFKSSIYKNLTEVVLNNMGKLLMESFLKRLESQYNESIKNQDDFGIDSNIINFLRNCEIKGIVSAKELSRIKQNLKSEYYRDYYSKIIYNLIKNSLLDNKYYLNHVEKELRMLF
jgi:ribosome-associated toxin RatA of RatAB toxin-antitoxin module